MSAASDSQLAPSQDLAPVLVGLLRREGSDLLRQRGRLHGLLRDYAPGAIRDIRLLLAAYDCGTPLRLEASGDPVRAEMLSAEAGRLVDEFGCAAPLAFGAVETWGRALAGLRGPAVPAAAHPVGLVAAAAPSVRLAPDAADEPGLCSRWGGIGFALLLVLVALARWLGWF